MSLHLQNNKYDKNLIESAVELEIGRGGQVYFVHNRIDSIFQRASSIQGLVPNARIGVGHGQMGEAALEKTMLSFMKHEYDVLVSTTIVENGLDIPLANTIIIENAEKQGLSEMYQPRGRVGRSNRRAYAYLLVSATWVRGSRSRRWIWNCAAREICWEASSTAISTAWASTCMCGCWTKRCAS